MLTELDHEFLARRRRTLKHLGTVTWLLPLIWIGGAVFACSRFPAMVDVFGIDDRLGQGIVDWALLRAMARVAPVLFVMLLIFVTVVMIGWLRMLYRERHLLELLERAARDDAHGP